MELEKRETEKIEKIELSFFRKGTGGYGIRAYYFHEDVKIAEIDFYIKLKDKPFVQADRYKWNWMKEMAVLDYTEAVEKDKDVELWDILITGLEINEKINKMGTKHLFRL